MPISKTICYVAFKNVAEKYLDPEDIDNFMLEHQERVKELQAADTLKSTAEAEAEAAKEIADRQIAEAMLQKRNAAQQTLKTLTRLTWIKQNYKPHEYNEALKNMLGGTVGVRRKGSLNSVASKMDAYKQKAECSFLTELRRNNLEEFFSDAKNEQAIMIELGEIREGGKPGRSGSEAAKQVAEIMERHQDFWRQEANRNGAFIEKLPGYIIAQTHEVTKLLPRPGETVDQAFDRWKNDIKPLLNWGRTAKGRPIDRVLREAWDGLVSGVHLDYTSGVGIATGGNKAQRLSNSRIFHFLDGEAFYKYNQMYGSGGLVWGYMHGLERLSKNAALMGEMGVNPQKMIDDLNKTLKVKASRSKSAGALRSMNLGNMETHWDDGVYNLFVEITGKNKVPGNEILAKVGQTARGVNSTARLGMSTISSFSDIGTQLNQALYLGLSQNESLVNMSRMLLGFSKNRLRPAERQFLSEFGLLTESLSMSYLDAVNVGSMGNGWMAKTLNRYFKAIGLERWTQSLKMSAALTIGHHLGEFLAKDCDWEKGLKRTMRQTLEAYNIGEHEMTLLKKMELIKDGNRHFIDTDAIYNIADIEFAKYLGIKEDAPNYAKRIKDAKIDLEMKLRTFMSDQVRIGVIEPNAVVKSWLNWGTQAGTVPGEVARAVAQFKAFPISVVTNILNPWIFNTTGAEKAVGITHLLLTTTALGYLSMACKDVLRGKTPQELNAKSIQRAMLQGGALGLMGDILFGDANTSSFVGSFAGPIAGMVDDAYHVYSKAVDIDNFDEDFEFEDYSRDVAAEAIRKFRNYIPFQNVFWMKLPLDHLIMYNLQERLNPGYLDRLERNLQNRTGQEYWLSPGQFVK